MDRDYYEVLGVSRDADKKEIKKAYFKLVRLFSPEKEPEHFQEIRQAYENLMAEDQGQEKFSVPADLFARKMLQNVIELFRMKKYALAADAAQEAMKFFGEEEAFLYYLAISQRFAGNTGRSVKNFEKLAALYPDKVHYLRELAITYMDRGYGRKAFAAFGKAYDRGCRDDEFLIMYSLCCQDRDESDVAIMLLRELVRKEKRSLRDSMDDMLEAYSGLFMLSVGFGTEAVRETICDFIRFIDRASVYMKEYEETVFKLATIMMGSVLSTGAENWDAANKALVSLEQVIPGENLNRLKKAAFGQREKMSLDRDERISMPLQMAYQAFADTPSKYEGDAQILRFMRLDAELCILEEWPDIQGELDIIEKEYPDYYKAISQFIERLKHMDKSVLRNRLLNDYDRLEANIDGGAYYEKYPQMRRRTQQVSWDSSEEGTFVRKEHKFGRNDPCPCGSGKKYKNCCGKNK